MSQLPVIILSPSISDLLFSREMSFMYHAATASWYFHHLWFVSYVVLTNYSCIIFIHRLQVTLIHRFICRTNPLFIRRTQSPFIYQLFAPLIYFSEASRSFVGLISVYLSAIWLGASLISFSPWHVSSSRTPSQSTPRRSQRIGEQMYI